MCGGAKISNKIVTFSQFLLTLYHLQFDSSDGFCIFWSHNFEITLKLQFEQFTICRNTFVKFQSFQVENSVCLFIVALAFFLLFCLAGIFPIFFLHRIFDVVANALFQWKSSPVSKFWIVVDLSVLCKCSVNLEYPCIHRYWSHSFWNWYTHTHTYICSRAYTPENYRVVLIITRDSSSNDGLKKRKL